MVTLLTTKGKDLVAVAALMGSLAVSQTIAIRQIRLSPQPLDLSLDPSPYGYTMSLALFIVPCLVFGIWLLRSPRKSEQRKAFIFTLLLLVPVGFTLDLLFGRVFLTFPNHRAILGVLLPGYDIRTGWAGLLGPGWEKALPLEEFVFYILGFITMLLIYVWGDEIIFFSNKVDNNQRTPGVFRGWKQTLSFWLAAGAVLFTIAWLIRRSVPAKGEHAFPGYFLFLLAGSIVPSLFCSRIAFQFINWRALGLAWLFILGISQFWEASLAIPYGWWGYQPDQMMGIFLKPFFDLPIEAVLVWTLGTWTTIIIYETILTAIYAGRSGWSIFSVIRASPDELNQVKDLHSKRGRVASPRSL